MNIRDEILGFEVLEHNEDSETFKVLIHFTDELNNLLKTDSEIKQEVRRYFYPSSAVAEELVESLKKSYCKREYGEHFSYNTRIIYDNNYHNKDEFKVDVTIYKN